MATTPDAPHLPPRMSTLGTETAFEVLARAGQLAAQGKDIINLGIGQPDFRTPDHIVEAACKALRDGHHGYTPAAGIPALREAVSADLPEQGKEQHGIRHFSFSLRVSYPSGWHPPRTLAVTSATRVR